MRFSGKNALVTGGASGIGAATALKLAQEGAQVIIADLNIEKAEYVIAKIRANGGSGFVLPVNLTDDESIQQCGELAAQKISALHILINNAGILRLSTIENFNPLDWDLQMKINLKSAVLMTKALLPIMKKEGGSIINISSEGAFRATGGRWVYDVTKAGMCSVTRTMAVEFQPYNIRVNAVAPGWTITEMHFGDSPDPVARKTELENTKFECIMGRLGKPEEIANAIAFLASDEASYITASTLHVDGGLVNR